MTESSIISGGPLGWDCYIMPNWTPSDDHRHRLMQTINHLTNRRASMMETDYPLTFEQVKLVTKPTRLAELVALGYDSLQKTYHIAYELGPAHGLGRRSITQINLPEPIHYAFDRQLHASYQEAFPIFFNRSAIDDETMARLKTWTELAVYERRLAALTNSTVADFITHTNPLTMYHIMARWPALKVAFKAVAPHYYARAPDIWERHSNEVGKDLHRWDWPRFGKEAEWREKYRKRMQLAEDTLISCVALKEPKQEPYNYRQQHRVLHASLADWQKLGGMPF